MKARRFEGMRDWLTAVLAAFCLGCAAGVAAEKTAAAERPLPVPPPDGVWRFDFGGAKSPAAAGYYRVLPDTLYGVDRGFGYTAERPSPRAFDQNRRVVRDSFEVDDVTRDGLYGGAPFRVDLADGAYRVVVLVGEYSRLGPNRPDAHFRAGSIRAGDAVLYEQDNSPEAFFDPAGRYFRNYYRDWQPDVNLYEANISQWIPFAEAEVEVQGGFIEVAASRYAPLNALWIYAVPNAAGPRVLREFKAMQAAKFNEQYPYLPEPPEHPMPEVPTAVRAAGVAIYARDDAQALRPGTRPVPRDFGRPLRLFAARGEREPGVIAVTPLRDLRGPVNATVSDLTGANGVRIPAAAFDVRYVRYTEYPGTAGYTVKPHFLVPWRPQRLDAMLTRGFWVDLHVPEDAAPGFYTGRFTLTAPGVRADLPVEVRVLPLSLPRCRLRAGVYAGELSGTTFRHYQHSLGTLPRELHRRVQTARMQFLADQGFTGLFDSLPWYPFEYRNGEIVATKTWDLYLDTFRIAASIPNFSDRIFCYYLGGPQFFPKCPHFLSLNAADKMALDEIVFSDEAVKEMTAMLQHLYAEIRRENLPELTFYVFDELGNHGAKGARWGREMLKALNRCRDAVPGGFRTCVSTLRASIAREYLPYADIVMPNYAYPVTAETIAEIRSHGCTLGLYNMGATRFSYGFYPWRVEAYTRAQWSFSYDGDSRDPFVALPKGARVSCDSHYTPEWEVLPSIGMLQQREGVDDYRYIQLLEESLAAATAAGRGDSDPVKAGQAVLAELREAVNMTYRDPENNWDRSTMDYYRWQVAAAALALAKE